MLEIVVLNLIIFVGTLVQGVLGFGLGVVCAPIIFLINPGYLPAPLIILSTLLTVSIITANRSELSIALVKWPIVGQTFGIIAAALLLASIDQVIFGFVFSLLLILAVLLTTFKFHLPVNPITGTLCGLVSGFSGTIVAIGGPPIALLFHSLSPKTALANMSSFFLVGCLMALVALGLVGRLALADLGIAVQLLPGLAGGYYLSRYLRNKLRPEWVKTGVLILSALLGGYLFVRYGWQLTH